MGHRIAQNHKCMSKSRRQDFHNRIAIPRQSFGMFNEKSRASFSCYGVMEHDGLRGVETIIKAKASGE